MIPVLSRAQIRRYDEQAIALGVPSVVLMENAGRAAAEIAADLGDGSVVVVCGPGNNGGDGFVLARHLLARGRQARCFLIGERGAVKGDARCNLDALVGLGGEVTPLEAGLEPLHAALAQAGLVVDALFGTGLTRPIEGAFSAAVAAINEARAACLSLDIPSGIDADSGAVLGTAVRAHYTVTFAHYKSGLLQGAGADHAGKISVVPLGVIDAPIVSAVGHTATVVAPKEVADILGRRSVDAHKYEAGSVVLAAGSAGKVGAAWLAGLGALRAGAGLVTFATWPEAADRLEGRLPEAMTLRLDPSDPARLLMASLGRARAAGVGPGFGLDAGARAAVEALALEWEGPVVLDADAITAFAGRPEALAAARGPRILTPHAGELARLLERDSASIEADRFASAREAATQTGATVVLKGWRTVIASNDMLAVCDRGDAVMAAGGAGDVLTGILTALSCSASPFDAARAGVFLHARAGERWREIHGADRGLLARELAELLPQVTAETQNA